MKKNPHAVALGRKGGSKATEAQKKAARTNGKKGGRPKAAKLYPSVYMPAGDIELPDTLHVTKGVCIEGASPRRHTRTEVPIGKGVAKARKGASNET